MNQGITTFSRLVVYLMALGAVAVCVIMLPELAREAIVEDPGSRVGAYLFLAGAYALFVPFFIALSQLLKLLRYIDASQAFSQLSVDALQSIKNCANVFSFMIVLGVTAAIMVARIADPTEDITPLVALGGILTFTSSVIATLAAVLQRLLQDAIDMKTENDLTV